MPKIAESVFRVIVPPAGVAGLMATSTSPEYARAGHPQSMIRQSAHARSVEPVCLGFDALASAGRAQLTRTTPWRSTTTKRVASVAR